MDAVTAVITALGVELPNLPRVAALVRKELTVAPLSLNDPFPKKFKVYLESPTRFVVPLHWARAALAPFQPRWRDARGAGEDARLDFKGSLRASLRQPEAVQAVLDGWEACGGAMLCLPVGFGKTLCALYLASVVKKKTLVLVHKAFLKDQWVERVGEFLPGARVTEVKGDVCDTSGDVVVAMIQTLVSRRYPPATFAPFGLVVADECFPARQRVATDGGTCAIGDVYARWRAGEAVMVQSFDEVTRTFAVKLVTHAWEKRAAEGLVEVGLSDAGGFESTPNHRVLTTGGWRSAGDLRPGDLLVSNSGQPAGHGTLRVTSVRRFKPEDTRVYDIEVEGTHTFVCCSVGGIGPVVHNCHHLAAQAFSRSMWGLCAPRVLGLSATPERKDGLVRVVSWFAGPIAFRVRRENQDTTRVKIVKYMCAEFDGPPPVNRRGDVCFTTVVTRLAENAHRTRALAREAGDLAAQGRDVLVLTHRRQHAKDLAEAIAALGVDVGTYMGGDKQAPTTRVIVATYALTSEGFDLPRLNALILATPASDVEQSCGRVMRGSSTRGAVIVDWVDQWGVCFSQHAKRRGFYKRSGFSMDPGQGRGEEEQAAPPQEFAFVNDDG